MSPPATANPRQPNALTVVTGLEDAQRQQQERDPLDEDRDRPGGAGELLPAPGPERQRPGHERGHPGVVVTPAGRMQGDDRVPPDEHHRGRTIGRHARGRQRGQQHGERGRDLEEPRGDVGRGRAADRLGRERERRAVDRRGVPPRGADEGEGGVVPLVGGDGAIGIRVVDGGEPGVAPVRPCVRGEEQRPRQWRQLDGDRHSRDRGERDGARAQQHPARHVGGERDGGRGEERPRPDAVATRMAAVQRLERRRVRPGHERRGEHERRRGTAQAERDATR